MSLQQPTPSFLNPPWVLCLRSSGCCVYCSVQFGSLSLHTRAMCSRPITVTFASSFPYEGLSFDFFGASLCNCFLGISMISTIRSGCTWRSHPGPMTAMTFNCSVPSHPVFSTFVVLHIRCLTLI